LSFDPEGKTIAVGEVDGTLRLFNALTGKITQVLQAPTKEELENNQISSIKCIRWKPKKSGNAVTASHNICGIVSEGRILHWNINTAKMISENDYHK
jgi:WD40 repeat protein